MQDIFHIILLSSGSVVALFILTKLMGYRQMSELSMFDYINGITIGSIAAEMATALEDGVTKTLTAMIVYAFFSVALSLKSPPQGVTLHLCPMMLGLSSIISRNRPANSHYFYITSPQIRQLKNTPLNVSVFNI